MSDFYKQCEETILSLNKLLANDGKDSGGEESECNALVSQRVSEPLQHPNLGDDSKQPEPKLPSVEVRVLFPEIYNEDGSEKKELYKCDECEYYNGTSGCWAIKGLYDQTHPKCTFKRKDSGGEE